MAEPASGVDVRPSGRCEEILDAAARLFSELGFEKTDTQRLADDLGVGKGTLYRYFPSKRDLFLAAADRAMRQLHEGMEVRVAGVEEPLDRIRRAVRAYLDHFEQHPGAVELLVQERAQFRDRPRPTFLEYRTRTAARWREVYRSLIREGRVRDMPVERITDVFAAVLYGTIFLQYFSGGSETFAVSAEDILDVIFFGILSDDERARLRPPEAERECESDPGPEAPGIPS
jgi:AcrR family transcriptional regulator